MLLGLERERTKDADQFAGVRTIGLYALAGGVAAYVDGPLERPLLGLGLFGSVAALVLISYTITAQRGQLGVTTELAALLSFMLGFLCVSGHVVIATGLAIASGVVVSLKEWLHQLARRIESADVEATLKFAIVSVIILPLVPNESFGPPPLDVINPYKIWLMVVLISGLNFASYLLVKMVGADHGIGLTGLLGGLVSSTAVTLGFSQRSREYPQQSAPLALGVLIAWTVMFARVVVLVGAVDRALLPRVGIAMLAFGVPSLVVCALLWRRRKTEGDTAQVSAGENPFELGQAIRFGLLFAVITFAAKAARVYLGEAGLYLAGAVAGLTDVDAISLSMAQFSLSDPSVSAPALRTIVIAVASNTLFKAGMAGSLGAPELRRVIVPAAAIILTCGVLSAVLL